MEAKGVQTAASNVELREKGQSPSHSIFRVSCENFVRYTPERTNSLITRAYHLIGLYIYIYTSFNSMTSTNL